MDKDLYKLHRKIASLQGHLAECSRLTGEIAGLIFVNDEMKKAHYEAATMRETISISYRMSLSLEHQLKQLEAKS